jgi:hypothetical protein
MPVTVPGDDIWVLARRNPGDVYGFDNPQTDPGQAGDRGEEAYVFPVAPVAVATVAGEGTVLAPVALAAVGGIGGLLAGAALYEYLNPYAVPEVVENPLPEVEVLANPPPKIPPVRPGTAEDFLDPPNWQEMFPMAPGWINPWNIGQFVEPLIRYFGEWFDTRFPNPWNPDAPTEFEVRPTIRPPDIPAPLREFDLEPFPQPQIAPRPTPGRMPGTLADPLEQPFGDPGPAYGPLPFAIPSPVALPRPGTRPAPIPAPNPVPGYLFDPAPFDIGLPSPSLFGFPEPPASPRTPVADPGIPRGVIDLPSRDIFNEPNPLEQPQIPRDAGRCPPCTTIKPKNKKRDKKARTACFRYVVTQYTDGTRQTEKKLIACEPRGKATRSKKPPAKKYPPGNPFPGLPTFRGI